MKTKEQEMSGPDYEHACAKILRTRGFSNVKVTKGSGDQGVDILAWKNGEKYAIQCKHYSNPVGNAAVQEVYAGKAFYGCDRSMVITNSTFTKSAKDLAETTETELWEHITPSEKASPLATLIGWFFAVVVAGYILKDYPRVLVAAAAIVVVAIVIAIIKVLKKHFSGSSVTDSTSDEFILEPVGTGSSAQSSESSAAPAPDTADAPAPEPDIAAPIDDRDALYNEAVEIVLETGMASATMLQLRLKVDYASASRIVDQMEEYGIIGPFEGSKPRKLLISRERWNELKIQSSQADKNGVVQTQSELRTQRRRERLFDGSITCSTPDEYLAQLDQKKNMGAGSKPWRENKMVAESARPSAFTVRSSTVWQILKSQYEKEYAEWESLHSQKLEEAHSEYEKIQASLVSAFADFGVDVTLQNSEQQEDNFIFDIKPGTGVRIKKIESTLADVAMTLGTNEIVSRPITPKSVIRLTIKSTVEFPPAPHKPWELACSTDADVRDTLFCEAVEIVLETGVASASMLQRQLKLGYAKASRIVDQMEEFGIIGPFEGSKPRKILISRELWNEMQRLDKENR